MRRRRGRFICRWVGYGWEWGKEKEIWVGFMYLYFFSKRRRWWMDGVGWM